MEKNLFLNAVRTHDTVTENGAVAHSSTGSEFIDQFASAGNYRNRNIYDVFVDQELLWKVNPKMALRFPFYLRMVTRKVKVHNNFVTEKVQNGQGSRDESFKRLLWIAQNHPTTFYKNIWVLPIIGSWKDLWTIMFYDIKFDINAIDRSIIFDLLYQGMKCDEHVELIKKFMPRIKSKSKLTTEWNTITNDLAKEFAKHLGLTAKEYNKSKASGTAHDFQKLICEQKYSEIKWNMIPGKALNLLVNSKFLDNHSLTDEYTKWIMGQPIAKFTGYVHELGKQVRECLQYTWRANTNELNMPLYKKVTIDKQFDSLIETARANGKINSKVWTALDTSGSMGTRTDAGVTAMDICTSLGCYFSTLNEGAFHKNVIMFDNTSRVLQLNGSFTDMMTQIPYNAMGGTNFQSVVDEICRVRRENPTIPLEDYPDTLLIVSDMQFNPTNSWRYVQDTVVERTNYEAMKSKLYEVFPTEFVDSMKFIWWNVASSTKNYPARMDDGGCYMLSGYDGAIMSMILGTEEEKTSEPKKMKSMEEIIHEALNQEILLQVNL